MRAATPGMAHRVNTGGGLSCVDIEYLLDCLVEVARQGDGQRQRWRVPPGLDRVHGLPRDPQDLTQCGLREPPGESELPHVVPHVSSLLYMAQGVKQA